MYSISIVFYLWKNTFKRWFESPISLLSKLILVALLGLFGVFILNLFAGLKQEISKRLDSREVNTVVITEVIQSIHAEELLFKSFVEEDLWSNRYGKDYVLQIWRPIIVAQMGNESFPILAYNRLILDGVSDSLDNIPKAYLLISSNLDKKIFLENTVDVNGEIIVPTIIKMPAWIEKQLGSDLVLAIPMVLAQPILKKGFIKYRIAKLSSLSEVSQYLKEIKAYYKAEKRKIQINSAEKVLLELKKVQNIQAQVKKFLALGVSALLAIILGAIAWLEFRDDSYMLALLRSFGVSPVWLFFHALCENIVIVLSVFLILPVLWKSLLTSFHTFWIQIELDILLKVEFSWSDTVPLVVAGVVGCILAVVPIAFALRKPPGVILR